MNKVQDIIKEIKKPEKELLLEIQKKEKEFFYKIKGKKVYFEAETKKHHKKMAPSIYTYLSNASLSNILTVPIIWFCIIPTLMLDFAVTVYQFICFKFYDIPKVKRKDYIVIDRHSLNYLNPIEKLNCVYCGYFNGLMAYIQEIGSRTEQYWCLIKHARKLTTIHKRYYKFLDYGDHQRYKNMIEVIRRDFEDIRDIE